MQQDTKSRSQTMMDADLLAVREMMAAAQSEGRPSDVEASASRPRAPRGEKFAKTMPRLAPQPVSEPAQQGRSARLAGFAWQRVRAYRPQRKRVLLTSLVLLFLLQPMFVLGWTAFGVVAVLICYHAMGGDAFWQRIVTLFRALERRRPAVARRIKLRSYAFSKKWERQIDRLPLQLADSLRLPDLRHLLAAEERHDAVLSDRLRKLSGDTAG